MSSHHNSINIDSSSTRTNISLTAQPESSSNARAQLQSLEEYTKARSASSNDCAWLHEMLTCDAVSSGEIEPLYHIRVYYKEPRDMPTTDYKDFGTGSSSLDDLEHFLASEHICAVILCHRDSSSVDPKVLELLWIHFSLEVSFMRHHFDYKEFKEEAGCPETIRRQLEMEENEDFWKFCGRWNPIQLPSETRGSTLRLSVGTESVSVLCKDGIIITFVRSMATYRRPLTSYEKYWGKRTSCPCTIDLYKATIDTTPSRDEIPCNSSEFSYSIVHFYARLVVLRCYEDYNLRHDPQPINLDESKRVASTGHPYIAAMHYRRLELVKLKQNLSGYLGPFASKQTLVTVDKVSGSAEFQYRLKLQDLVNDIEMLLSLYDHTMRIYERHIHETDSDYKGELASEQLEEAKESKATAISLGKLSNMAFLYLPMNFVCSMLGMNLSIFGQGSVPVYVFLALILLFSLLTYLPVYLPKMDDRKSRLYRLAYNLAWRSIPAGFWFLAFTMTHSYGQSFEIMNSGLAQTFLGYTGARTKGWTAGRNDDFFEKATLGSQSFWKKKVEMIFLAVEELKLNTEPTELTV